MLCAMCLTRACVDEVNFPTVPRFSKFIFWIFTPLGLIVLILAASRGELVSAQEPTSTIDRLAKPTLPANPSQADQGAVDYWLNCSPCHGDRGQGLTDEFRVGVYPTEDQNCWLSGCHGRRHYTNGWTLPTTVPALIGPGALSKFGNGAVLEAFISLKMPFQNPGGLKADTYWNLTAYLLRQNGYWAGDGILDSSSAERVRIPFAQLDTSQPAATPQPTASTQAVETSGSSSVRIVAAGLLLLMGLVFFLLVRRKKI